MRRTRTFAGLNLFRCLCWCCRYCRRTRAITPQWTLRSSRDAEGNPCRRRSRSENYLRRTMPIDINLLLISLLSYPSDCVRRMNADQLSEGLAARYHLLRELAEGDPAAEVPSCPGW